jgi:hypothetical protein
LIAITRASQGADRDHLEASALGSGNAPRPRLFGAMNGCPGGADAFGEPLAGSLHIRGNTMTSTTPSAAVSSPSPASDWQVALATLSLAAFSCLVAAPVALLLLVLWAAVLAIASAGLLDAAGALDLQALCAALAITGSLLAFGAGMALASKLSAVGQRRAIALAISSPQGGSWLLRRPFVGVGGLLLLVDLVLLPLAYARLFMAPSWVLGAGVIGGAAMLLALAACALFRGWWSAIRALWTGARRSSFVAGLVTASSLVAALIVYLLACVALGVASALLREVPLLDPRTRDEMSGEQSDGRGASRPARCASPADEGAAYGLAAHDQVRMASPGRGQDDTLTQAGRSLRRFHQAATCGRAVMSSPAFATTRAWRYGIQEMSASE